MRRRHQRGLGNGSFNDSTFPGQRHIKGQKKSGYHTPQHQGKTAVYRESLENQIGRSSQQSCQEYQHHFQVKLTLGLQDMGRCQDISLLKRTVQGQSKCKREEKGYPQDHGGQHFHVRSDLTTVHRRHKDHK